MQRIIDLLLNIRGGLNHLGDYGYIDSRPMGERIPQVVHQTYFTKHLPEEIQENLNTLQLTNPDWEFRLYDDADIEQYIRQHYPTLIHTFQKINPDYGVAKADLFRYLVIYNEGGVYLDIKSSVQKPLNEIIQSDDYYLLSHWQNAPGQIHQGIGFHRSITHPRGEFQQWHVIARRGHPFLKAVIENVCHNIHHYNPLLHDTGGWGVVNLTGPIAYTLAITTHLQAYPHRDADTNAEFGLIYSIYETKDFSNKHHKQLNKHYTERTDSIVRLSFLKGILFRLLNPTVQAIKNQLLKHQKRLPR